MSFRQAQGQVEEEAGEAVLHEFEDAEFDEDEEEYDEDEEEVDEDEEDADFDGQVQDADEEASEEESQAPFVPPRASGAASTSQVVKPWSGIQNLPPKTQQSFRALLQQLKSKDKNKLTILLLGKSMMGKSSTANSLFAEPVTQIRSFQQDTSRPEVFRRSALGFELSVIDTPGLLESDAVNTTALKAIAQVLKDNPVDVVLYLDRLDFYRVERTDQDIMSAITNTLGPKIWRNTVIGLTHGKAVAPPGTSQDEYFQKRVDTVRKAIRAAGAGKEAALPAAFIENSSHCLTNDDDEKVIGPNRDKRWLPDLMTEIVNVAQSVTSFKYDASTAKKQNPNRKRRWLIPLLILAQVAFKKYVIDGILEDDGVTGDQYGPYDAETIKEERDRLKKQKESRKVREQSEKEKRAKQAAKKKQKAQSQIASSAAKAKHTVQKALPGSDDSSSSSSDSSSDDDY